MHTLLVDIGNSTVVAAVMGCDGVVVGTWRIKTRKDAGAAYYRTGLDARVHDVASEDIGRVVVSSVVPEVNDAVAAALRDVTGHEPHFFGFDDAQRVIDLDVESPALVGKDRLADAVGAACCYGTPAIVFDMGTATTVGVVDEGGTFLGGMIIPGVKTSLNALSSNASQLPEIRLDEPGDLIGRNTEACMRSGILYGTAAMVDGLIERLLPRFTQPVHLVATGGMSRFVVPLCRHQIQQDDFLQFKGLFLAMNRNA